MQKYIVDFVNSIYSKKSMAQLLFAIILCFVIHLWILQYFYYFANNLNVIMSIARKRNNIEHYPNNSKFLLVWNKHDNIMKGLRRKNNLLNCSVYNCVFTDDKSLLYDYIRYDAIVFNELALNSIDRPDRRSRPQLYIFSSQKSSYDAPACDLYNDNFFNLTFTYRLDSDVLWSYLVVRNLSGVVVAPSASVTWKKSLSPVSSDIKSILARKKIAAVWIVNDDKPEITSVEYVTRLREHLFHYSLKIDIYRQPPISKCPNNYCQKMITDKYYFYLAFENYFSIDYVSNTVVHGYNSYSVPIVYGGANYSRFLPPDSYINARVIHPYNLAFLMHNVIKEPSLYEAYFRWKNLYTIEDNSKSLTSLCELCNTVHRYNANAVPQLANKQFRRWWNGLNGMKNCLSEEYKREKSNLNVDDMFNLP